MIENTHQRNQNGFVYVQIPIQGVPQNQAPLYLGEQWNVVWVTDWYPVNRTSPLFQPQQLALSNFVQPASNKIIRQSPIRIKQLTSFTFPRRTILDYQAYQIKQTQQNYKQDYAILSPKPITVHEKTTFIADKPDKFSVNSYKDEYQRSITQDNHNQQMQSLKKEQGQQPEYSSNYKENQNKSNNSNIPQQQQNMPSNGSQQQQEPKSRQDSGISRNSQNQSERPDIPQVDAPKIQPLPFPKLIDELYDLSLRKRYVDPRYSQFIREKKNEIELFKNYSIRQGDQKQKLKQYCTAFREVRGDGNCFYTSFGYQFLQILINSDEEYQKFIKTFKPLIKFEIHHNEFEIQNQNDQDQISEFFYGTLEQLRQYQNRGEELLKRFQTYEQQDEYLNGMFYGASIIFFRNLANYVVEFSEMKQVLFDRQNLLKWETECNNNEIVIAALAEQLKLKIQLLFFDAGTFKLTEYGSGNENKIILLIKPGHYNIGYLE